MSHQAGTKLSQFVIVAPLGVGGMGEVYRARDTTLDREVAIKVDYCGFPVEKGFLVGYGLDYDEQYRYLPDIYALI